MPLTGNISGGELAAASLPAAYCQIILVKIVNNIAVAAYPVPFEKNTLSVESKDTEITTSFDQYEGLDGVTEVYEQSAPGKKMATFKWNSFWLAAMNFFPPELIVGRYYAIWAMTRADTGYVGDGHFIGAPGFNNDGAGWLLRCLIKKNEQVTSEQDGTVTWDVDTKVSGAFGYADPATILSVPQF